MKTIGKTVILDETESMYHGECTTDIVNRANNIISIHRETGELSIFKVKNLSETNNLVKMKHVK